MRRISIAGGAWGPVVLAALLSLGGARAADDLQAPRPAGGASTAAAAPADLAAAEDVATRTLLDGLDARWLRRRALVTRGDRSGAEEAARDLAAALRDEGIGRLPALGRAALLEGEREQRRGDPRAAAAAFRLARTLDPQLAAAYWREAQARRAAGAGPGETLPLVGGALRARWTSFWPRWNDVVSLGVLLLGALLAAGAAVVLTLLVAHGPVLVHEAEERFPSAWHPAWRRTFGWSIVLAPLAVQGLGAFALVLWSVALVPAGTRAERRAIGTFLLIVALAVPAAGALWALAALPASPGARAAVAGAERALDARLLPGLDALASSRPREASWKVLAARTVAPREPERALELLRAAAEIDPGDARIRIALGNVYYRLGKREAAAVFFREAAELDPRSVLALYNLSRTRAAMLDTRQAEESLAQARALSAEEVRRLERVAVGDGVVEPEFPVGEVAGRLVRDEALPAARQAIDFMNPISLGAVAALLAALLVGMRGQDYDARRCPRCGAGFCNRCAGQERGVEICTACAQLFGRREGLAPKARQAQARRVDRRIRLLARGRALAQLVWPGLALVHEGRTGLGFLQAAAWAFLVGGALLPGRLLPPGPPVGPWGAGVPFAAAALLFWLVAQLPPLRPLPVGRQAGR